MVNYIPLNHASVRDQYPMPSPQVLFNFLEGARFFTIMDATEGFHQIMIDPKDRHYAAFTTTRGLYQYKRVPFGYTNSPAAFQRTMNQIFKDGIGKRLIVYVDDLLVFGRTPTEHHQNLAWTLEQCRLANIKINPNKCQFFKSEVIFLGRRISEDGIAPVFEDLDIIKQDRPPTNKMELRSLIGHLVFVSPFIPEYSELTQPLNMLLHKNKDFVWTKARDKILHRIRRLLTEAAPHRIPQLDTAKLVELSLADLNRDNLPGRAQYADR